MYEVDSAMCREWSKELDDMIEEFKNMSITQANNYIEHDLKNWIASVCSMIVNVLYTD